MEKRSVTISILGAAILLAALAADSSGQTPKTVWDTPDELMEWIGYPGGIPKSGATNIERREEDGRQYLRMLLAPPNPYVVVGIPGGDWAHPAFDTIESLPPLKLDPKTHDAVKVTWRHSGMGLDHASGFWLPQSADFDIDVDTLPHLELYPSPDDGEWHEITFKLTDSPYLNLNMGVSVISIMPVIGTLVDSDLLGQVFIVYNSSREHYGTAAFLDIDKIEFIKLEEVIPTPIITDFNPKRGRYGTEVTIEGSGFAEPASRNVVYLDDIRQEILSGNSTTLRVKMEGGAQFIIVLTPGGGKAATSVPLKIINRPCKIAPIAGDNQTAKVRSKLKPLFVKVTDACEWTGKDGEGVPGEKVVFRIVQGAGSLTVKEAITDDNGIASTILTLGPMPGVVKVVAEHPVGKVNFTATATSP
jgi:hypothetical protein